jgi:hypothetical protein
MIFKSKRVPLRHPFNARRAVALSRILVGLTGSIGLTLVWILSHTSASTDDYGWLLLVLLFGPPTAGFICVRIIRDFWYKFAWKRPHLETNGRHYIVIAVIVFLTIFVSMNDRALRLRFVFERSTITRTLDAVARRCANPQSPRPTFRGRNVEAKCDGSATGFTAGRWNFVLLTGDYGYVRSANEPGGTGEYRKVSTNIWVWTTADGR